MNENISPDMSCYPYARKKAYFAITIPFIIVIVLVLLFLFTIDPLVGFLFIFFWVWANFFQAYCCAYQDCPYAHSGEHFCPAVVGIIPASFIARTPLISKIRRSAKLFEWSATFGSLGLVGMILLPLFFLFEVNILLPIGYLIIIVIYAFFFLKVVCPACSIRGTCPGGRASIGIFGKK